jgi:predicted RNA-binding protein YlqC (UPF0109 family)
MVYELDTEKLVFRIVSALVDDLREVRVQSITTETGTIFEVTVAATDIGKVIGKQGRNAGAIRVLLSAIGHAANKRYGLDVVTSRLHSS